MKIPIHMYLFALTVLLSTLGTASFAQEDDGPGPRLSKYPTFEPGEVDLFHYSTKRLPPSELLIAVDELYGRKIIVKGIGNDQTVNNLFLIGEVIAIYDQPAYAARVLDALKKMESIPEDPSPSASSLRTVEYRPRFIPLKVADEVLESYVRNIVVQFEDGFHKVRNISLERDRMLIILRDVPTQVEEMLALLKRVDVPAPQVILTAYVLTTQEGGDDPAVPAALAKNLRTMVPTEGFKLESMGLVRTAVTTSQPIRLEMASSVARSSLEILPVAHDTVDGGLTLERCTFSRGVLTAPQGFTGYTELFSTSTTLLGSEYTVLGAAGEKPIFVVLRVTPAP